MMSQLSQRPRHNTTRLWIALGVAVLLILAFGMTSLSGVFAFFFPEVARPVYLQESFSSLLWSHVVLVLASSTLSVVVGVGAAVVVTRPSGQAFRPLLETLSAIGQTFPPVAVLAMTVPFLGFGARPALLALALYGLLPIVQATISGLSSVPTSLVDTARGMGLSAWQRFEQVEWPLALPIVIAGIRTSVSINIGTATVASVAGAQTLGTPILIGLQGFNTGYVLQGAILVGLLAVIADLSLEYWQNQTDHHGRKP